MAVSAAEDPRPVLVAGASGYLGSFVCKELLRRGCPVRALVRRAGSPAAAALAAADCDVRAVDAAQPGALAGVCDGCRAVASCLAADMHWQSGTPESVDRDANIALFKEAATATATAVAAGAAGGRADAGDGGGAASRGGGGVDSGAAGVRTFLLVATYEGREAKAHVPLHQAKEAAVDYIEAAAPAAGIAYTILRPTAYFKDFTDYPFERMQRSSWMLVPGGGRSRYNPIDGAELAAFIADCLLQGKCAKEEVRIGGPEVVTFQEVAYRAAEAAGRPRSSVWLLPLPTIVMRAAAAVAGLLAPVWPAAASLHAGLRFAIYSSAHDSVGMRYGSRTVADHYRDLLAAQQQRQQEQRQPAEQSPPGEQRVASEQQPAGPGAKKND